MSDLENGLRRLAANGELTYLSLIPVAGKGQDGVVFHASVSPSSRFGHSDGRDADPVKALEKAIESLPKGFTKAARRVVTQNPGEAEPWDTP